jgi:subtilisin family serine protease
MNKKHLHLSLSNNNPADGKRGWALGKLLAWTSTVFLGGIFFAAGFFYSAGPNSKYNPAPVHKDLGGAGVAGAGSEGEPEAAAANEPVAAHEVNRNLPETPSPLDQPSKDELRRYPGAKVRESAEVPGPQDGQATRVRILETGFKYPFVRTEEVLDSATGQLLSREEMVADHILVTLAEGEDPLALLTSLGSDAVFMERVTPDVPLYRLHLSSASAEALPKALEATADAGSVLLAEPDFIVHINRTPNDPRFLDGSLWGLHQGNDVDVDAPEAWDVRTSAASVVVAVIDTGVRYTHQDLAANMWRNTREIPGNGRDDDNNGVIDDIFGLDACNNDGDPNDDHGHGTHCAGTIGAVGNNGIGITGVAWQVRLMALKFLSAGGSGASSDAIRCIDYARSNGAKIMSNSWGGGGPSASLLASIERARGAGILFVAAAGNDYGRNTDSSPNYPSSYASDNIVSVAATDSSDRLASFSNFGPTSVDLGAPGVGILSSVASSDSAYESYSGTSMATPHVAGALAVLAAQFPQDNHSALIRRLLSATDPNPSLRGRTVSGGRLNLANALQGSTPTPPPPTAPVNDNFLAGLPQGGTSWTASGSNLNGTAEAGEPVHAGNAASKSVWWIWTAPATGTCTLRTDGSSFDTVLAVYTGDAVNRLTPVVSNDNSGVGTTQSSVNFSVRQGVTYRIVVDGKLGASGDIVLGCQTVPAGPANDHFGAATTLTGATLRISGTNLNATSEAGEPNHAGVSGRKSVWWNWTAPSSGVLTLSTAGSSYDTTLAVYSGSAVSALSHLASNDDEGRELHSRVALTVVAGTVYRIAVDGYAGATGAIQLAGTLQTQPALGIPSGVSALRDPWRRVVVRWNAVSGAAAYDVILARGNQIYAAGRVAGTCGRTSGSVPTIPGLTASVRAVDAAGRSGSWSVPVAVH